MIFLVILAGIGAVICILSVIIDAFLECSGKVFIFGLLIIIACLGLLLLISIPAIVIKWVVAILFAINMIGHIIDHLLNY